VRRSRAAARAVPRRSTPVGFRVWGSLAEPLTCSSAVAVLWSGFSSSTFAKSRLADSVLRGGGGGGSRAERQWGTEGSGQVLLLLRQQQQSGAGVSWARRAAGGLHSVSPRSARTHARTHAHAVDFTVQRTDSDRHAVSCGHGRHIRLACARQSTPTCTSGGAASRGARIPPGTCRHSRSPCSDHAERAIPAVRRGVSERCVGGDVGRMRVCVRACVCVRARVRPPGGTRCTPPRAWCTAVTPWGPDLAVRGCVCVCVRRGWRDRAGLFLNGRGGRARVHVRRGVGGRCVRSQRHAMQPACMHACKDNLWQPT
jgi:hypothetical protein